MVRLIERFWEEHYEEELPRRRPVRMARPAAGEAREQAIETMKRLSGRPTACLEAFAPGRTKS